MPKSKSLEEILEQLGKSVYNWDYTHWKKDKAQAKKEILGWARVRMPKERYYNI